jgi:hypothetical protein
MIAQSLFSLFLILAAQTNTNASSINGSVVDSNKKPIKGAQVLILPSSHPAEKTKEDGTFSVDSLEPGEYTVIIIAETYSPWAQHRVRLQEGQKATLDVILLTTANDRVLVKYNEPRQKDLDSYTPALKAFSEPRFCSEALLKEKYESYRFLWLRTFNHPVFIQLISRGPGNAVLIYKELDGKGGYGYGSPIVHKTLDPFKKLGKGELPKDMVQGAFDIVIQRAKAGVWEQPYKVDDGTIGLDGATWTIEAIKDGKCHVVERWSPEQKDVFRWFADDLIRFSDKRFYYDEFY